MTSQGRKTRLDGVIQEFYLEKHENPIQLFIDWVMKPGGKLKPKPKTTKRIIASNKNFCNVMINIMKG